MIVADIRYLQGTEKIIRGRIDKLKEIREASSQRAANLDMVQAHYEIDKMLADIIEKSEDAVSLVTALIEVVDDSESE